MKEQPPFEYSVDFNETVPDGKGGRIPRYGRKKDPAFRHLGADAPSRADGALYDVLDPMRDIMPTNYRVVPGEMKSTGTGTFRIQPDKLVFCPLPGVSAFGD